MRASKVKSGGIRNNHGSSFYGLGFSAQETPAPEKSKSLFRNMVSKAQNAVDVENNAAGKKSLDSMLIALEQSERDMQQTPTRENFLLYRNQVRTLLSHLQQKVFSNTTLTSGNKELQIVRVINKNLHELYQKVMKPQSDTLIILLLMGQIRGLLLSELG